MGETAEDAGRCTGVMWQARRRLGEEWSGKVLFDVAACSLISRPRAVRRFEAGARAIFRARADYVALSYPALRRESVSLEALKMSKTPVAKR